VEAERSSILLFFKGSRSAGDFFWQAQKPGWANGAPPVGAIC